VCVAPRLRNRRRVADLLLYAGCLEPFAGWEEAKVAFAVGEAEGAGADPRFSDRVGELRPGRKIFLWPSVICG